MRLLSDSSSQTDLFRFGFLVVSRLLPSLACLVALGNAYAQEPSPPPPQQATITISREVKEVFERSAKAVVKIRAMDEHGKLFGTGFFIDPTGTLYTAYSVAGDADDFTVEFDGKEVPARAVMRFTFSTVWSASRHSSPDSPRSP